MRLGVSGSVIFALGVGSKYAVSVGRTAWDIKKHPRRGMMYKKAATRDVPVLRRGATDATEALQISIANLREAQEAVRVAGDLFSKRLGSL